MRHWQAVCITLDDFDGEASRTVRALQALKAVDGDAGRAGDELDKLGLLLRVKLFLNTLQSEHGLDGWNATRYLPKPLHNWMFGFAVSVVRVLLPIGHVELGDTAD